MGETLGTLSSQSGSLTQPSRISVQSSSCLFGAKGLISHVFLFKPFLRLKKKKIALVRLHVRKVKDMPLLIQ